MRRNHVIYVLNCNKSEGLTYFQWRKFRVGQNDAVRELLYPALSGVRGSRQFPRRRSTRNTAVGSETQKTYMEVWRWRAFRAWECRDCSYEEGIFARWWLSEIAAVFRCDKLVGGWQRIRKRRHVCSKFVSFLLHEKTWGSCAVWKEWRCVSDFWKMNIIWRIWTLDANRRWMISAARVGWITNLRRVKAEFRTRRFMLRESRMHPNVRPGRCLYNNGVSCFRNSHA